MWRRTRGRKWFCAVMASALLAGLAGFPGEAAVRGKAPQDAVAADTVSGNQTLMDTTEKKETFTKADESTEAGTASGNEIPSDVAEKEPAEEPGMHALLDEQEIQENTNIMFPSRLEVAFNPLGLAVGTKDGGYSTSQIISGNYEIINKGSADQIITVTINVEDLNGGQIQFLDSLEAVESAGKDDYAVYLAVVSVEEQKSGIGDDGETAVPIHEGENQVSFRLPAGNGMAAFTFDGVMNRDAEWWELSQGIKISTVYSCETVKGDGVGGADALAMEE